MRVIIRDQIDVRNITLVVTGITLLVAGLFALIIGLQRPSYAAPVPDSCFTFNSGTGTIEDYNAVPDVDCLDDVTIPATIGGTPVTTIAGSAFDNPSLTSVEFPASITLIEANAFPAGVTLSSITLDVTGNLIIESNAFEEYVGTSLVIAADGNLTVSGSFAGSTSLTLLELSSGGTLVVNQGSFGSVETGTLRITSGDTLTLDQGSFGDNNADVIELESVGDLTITGGSLYGSTLTPSTISVQSDNDITMSSGALGQMSGTMNAFTMAADGDIVLGSSAVSEFAADVVSITAGGLIDINAAVYDIVSETIEVIAGTSADISAAASELDADTVTIQAGTALTLTSSLYALDYSGMTVNLTAGTGLLTLTGGSLESNSTVDAVVITAPSGLDVLQGSLFGLTGLETLDFNLGGDVSMESGALSESIITDLAIETDGAAEIVFGSLDGMPNLETLTITSGGDLEIGSFGDMPALTDVTVTSGAGAMVINNGTFYDSPNIERASFVSGGDITFSRAVLSDNLLNELTIQAPGTVVIGDYVFMNNNLTTVTLPAGTTSIGDFAFTATDLDTVYIAGTPVIGSEAFQYSGGTYNLDTFEYESLDQVKYVQLYTVDPSNPAGYVDTVDGANGGYLVNPASYLLTYTADGEPLQSAGPAIVGELEDGSLLTSYLLSANEEGLDSYYRPGDVQSFSAPSFDGYLTPDPIQLTMVTGLNIVNFVYEPILAGVPNTGIGRTEGLPLATLVVVGTLILTGSGLMAYAAIRRT